MAKIKILKMAIQWHCEQFYNGVSQFERKIPGHISAAPMEYSMTTMHLSMELLGTYNPSRKFHR